VKGELPEPTANVPYTSINLTGNSNTAREIETVILAGIRILQLPNGTTPPTHVAGSLKAPV
jgi:hypothetical protein